MPSGNPNIAEAGKNTQWQKGQTGNADGKPKGTKHLTTHIQELLEDEEFEADLLDSKKGLIEFKGRPIAAIIQVLRHKAVNGDLKAAELLMKYGWSQKIEQDITSNGETVGQPVDENLLTQFLMNIQENTKR